MQQLNKLMQERHISNYRLAKELNIVEGTIRKWRRGETEPRAKNLLSLAAFLNIEPAYLRYGNESHAPTYKDEVLKIAKELAPYIKRHPERIPKIKKIIELFIEEEKNIKEGKALRYKAGSR